MKRNYSIKPFDGKFIEEAYKQHLSKVLKPYQETQRQIQWEKEVRERVQKDIENEKDSSKEKE